MSLLDTLNSWARTILKDKQVEYRVRWSAEPRVGTVRKVTDTLIWVGCFVYSHSDITAMREVS
jgi:hypothetical protein